MRESSRNVLVGLFMVAGLAVLGTLMVLFGEKPSWLGGAEYELRVEFREVSGVTEGMPIYLNGVQVGRVDRLEFRNPKRPDLGVDVIGLIKDHYIIPAQARAEVQPGLLGLGRGRIDIIPPEVETQALARDEAEIEGAMGNPFGDLIPETMLASLEKTAIQIGNLAEEATPLADDLHLLFQLRTTKEVDAPQAATRGIVANLYTVVQRLDTALKNINDVLGDPEFKTDVKASVQDFRRMMADGKETSATLRRTATELETDLDRIANRLDTGLADANQGINDVRDRLVPTLDTASELMGNLNRVSRGLAEGEGTAGLFLRDERLYEALLLSVQRLTDAVDTIRRIADRFEQQGYIEFKMHEAAGPLPYQGRKEIPPPPK